MKNKVLKKKRYIFLLAGILAVGIIGSTFAFWKGEVKVENELTADTVDVDIDENFPDPSTDGSVTKEVKFTNTGSSEVFLRVACVEYWEKTVNDETVLLPNQVTVQDALINVATKAWNDGGLNNEENWVKGNDGWYYYKKILAPGESTPQILDSVSFPNYEQDPYKDYKDADYHLYFKTEVVQCTPDDNNLNKKATEEIFRYTGQVDDEDGTTVTWTEMTGGGGE